MDNYLSIFQGILSTEENFLDIYLQGLEEHKKFVVQSNEAADLVQHITSLLTKSTTRQLGLRLLAKFLDQCSIDVLENKGNLWTTLILKACNYQELQLHAPLIFEVFGKLVKRSQQSPDFTKTFSSTHISKVYEVLTNTPACKAKYALSYVEICLRTYPGSSGPSRGIIERFLWKNIDHIDGEVVKNCGKCLHLLQQVKGGAIQGINHKTQWKNYQLQLLGGIHAVYNEMFSNCVEMYEEKIEQEILPWEKEQKKFDHDPVKKAAQMYLRCHNLIKYLIIALREPFPVEKPILVKKILNVIIRGLSVNCILLERNPIADNIALSILLPKLHVDLLELLNVTILILRGHLRPYSDVILGLIVDAFKWTSLKNAQGDQKPLSILRRRIYETVSLWCKIFNSGNRCDTIAEYLFQEILSDITPTQSEFTLKVLSGARKHMSKKARRQLHNAQNEKANMAQNHSSNNNRKDLFSEVGNHELCKSALRCLQEILFSVGNFIKPNLLKMMQTNIIQICATFYELPLKPAHLYSNKNCRIEIYNALFAIIMTPHYLCPPPTEIAFTTIQNAYTCDVSLKVRTHCFSMIKHLEKIIHPQKESLLFTIEERDIRNAFIKIGQENLLLDFGINLLNNNYNKDDVTDLNNTASLQASNNSVNDPQNDDIEDNNKCQTASNTVSEKVELVQNAKTDATVRNVGESVNDLVATVNNVESINKQINDEDILLKITNNGDNAPKSPEFVLRVEDDGDISTIDEEDSNIDNKIDEPITKKQKLDNEHSEAVDEEDSNIDHKIDESITKNQKLDNEYSKAVEIKNDDAGNVSHLSNLEDDEDNLLAEIASQFVDELD